MRPEETMINLTTRTPNGGGFWAGSSFVIVQSGPDWWEWKCRGKVYYDLDELADALIRRRGIVFRPERHRLWTAKGKRGGALA